MDILYNKRLGEKGRGGGSGHGAILFVFLRLEQGRYASRDRFSGSRAKDFPSLDSEGSSTVSQFSVRKLIERNKATNHAPLDFHSTLQTFDLRPSIISIQVRCRSAASRNRHPLFQIRIRVRLYILQRLNALNGGVLGVILPIET